MGRRNNSHRHLTVACCKCVHMVILVGPGGLCMMINIRCDVPPLFFCHVGCLLMALEWFLEWICNWPMTKSWDHDRGSGHEYVHVVFMYLVSGVFIRDPQHWTRCVINKLTTQSILMLIGCLTSCQNVHSKCAPLSHYHDHCWETFQEHFTCSECICRKVLR